MNKSDWIFSIAMIVGAAMLFLISVQQGLEFGLTVEGPAIKGWAGGLLSTVTAIFGTLFLVRVYNIFRCLKK